MFLGSQRYSTNVNIWSIGCIFAYFSGNPEILRYPIIGRILSPLKKKAFSSKKLILLI